MDRKQYNHEYYIQHREQCTKRNRDWVKNNPEKARKIQRKSYRKNRVKHLVRTNKRTAGYFRKCLDHYGYDCEICGSTKDPCMDHIGGNRGESPECGTALWLWLIKNNFPPGFRTLCNLCNIKDAHTRRKKGVKP